MIRQYEPTTDGYAQLHKDDSIIAEASRDVVFLFLPQHFNKDNKTEGYNALINLANLIGFKIKTFEYKSGDKIKIGKRFPKYRNQAFYSSLFSDFKNDIKNIQYNPDDEHGICDETVMVANIAYKYQKEIALKIKRKSFFENIKLFLQNFSH